MTLASNMLVNAVARVWLAVLHLALTPLIVAILGPDSYGIVAFSLTVLVMLTFLDQALSPLLLRELAALGPDPEKRARAGDLLRTLEVLSWAMGAAIGLAIAAAAPAIADHLLARTSLDRSEVILSVRIIGFTVAAHWPGLLYAGGLMGLQRQDRLVAIRLVTTMAAYGGGILLITSVRPVASVYLAWSGTMALLGSIAMRQALWRTLGRADRQPVFDLTEARPLWRFGLDSLLIGLTAVLLSQLPGFFVARIVSVADFAAYALAMTLTMQISTLLTQPVTATLLPHFSRLAAEARAEVIEHEHHRWSQIITALALPAIATLAFYAEPLMRLWLGNASPLVAPVAQLLPLAALGTLFNIIVTPLYVVPVALKRTRLVLAMNLMAVIVMVPVNLWLIHAYGTQGAVLGWAVVNLGYYLLGGPALHAALLPGQIRRWWLNDTLAPCMVVGAVYGAAWLFWPMPASLPAILLQAVLLVCAAILLLLLTQTHVRQAAADGIGRTRAALKF